ncbi:MAG: PAS domain-containing protein [Mariprofundaceae bacterium]
MRVNMPVTDIEQTFGDNEFIVSKTNTKGHITYMNDIFLRIAGFKEDELLGKPHNMIRHPDMPRAAFADLWNTIKGGNEWHGIVKNRCKNGDYYWVDATVTPSLDSRGSIIGYMSVRRRPTSEQIQEAETLYVSMRNDEGHQGGVR